MTGSQGGGYSGPPSTPSAPPVPAGYSGQPPWDQQSKYNPGLPSQSSGPPSYSSGAPSYGSAPPSYSSATPSLSYSDSMRSQYSPQSSFSAQRPPTTAPYGDSSSYGQPPAPNTYGQQPSFKQEPYGKPSVSQSPYSDPSKMTSSYQSVSAYGQTPAAPAYGQPAAPSTYGQASKTSSYGQPPPSTYGQPSHLGSFSKPMPQGPPSYGQPSSQYGQTYGQPSPYPQSSYPPAFSNPYGQAFRPRPQFPSGTDPDIIRAFEMGDVDGSGLIDAAELGRILSQGLPFSIRTVHLMLHMYNPNGSNSIGPTEFVTLWTALKDWKACFERFDRDRSGRIDSSELREALLSMGYAISAPLLAILISKYDRTGQSRAMDYDNFVECGLVVKGLTDKFKSKDLRFTGSATLDFETFMLMVLPFIVA